MRCASCAGRISSVCAERCQRPRRGASIDDAALRLAWSASGERLSHHNAAAQVLGEGAGSRVVWIADLLPDAMAAAVASMIEAGLAVMKATLEADAAAGRRARDENRRPIP